MAFLIKSGNLNPMKLLAAKPFRGFTLIELLVVLAIVGLLVTLAVPRYFGMVDKSRETVLRHDLATIREALDKYYEDTGKYPDAIDDLVAKKYLRKLPQDPITVSDQTWIAVPPESGVEGNVFDVKSGATGTASDGSSFSSW